MVAEPRRKLLDGAQPGTWAVDLGDLGLVARERQLAGEADGFGGQVDPAGIALVEDQVQHAQHDRDVAGRRERLAADRPLRAAERALTYRAARSGWSWIVRRARRLARTRASTAGSSGTMRVGSAAPPTPGICR